MLLPFLLDHKLSDGRVASMSMKSFTALDIYIVLSKCLFSKLMHMNRPLFYMKLTGTQGYNLKSEVYSKVR